MIVCDTCGWRGSGEHDCIDQLRDRLEWVVQERDFFEAEVEKLRAALLAFLDADQARDTIIREMLPGGSLEPNLEWLVQTPWEEKPVVKMAKAALDDKP